MSRPQVKTILIFITVYYKNVISVIYNSINLEFQSPLPVILALFRKHSLHMGLKSVNSTRQERGKDKPCDPDRNLCLIPDDMNFYPSGESLFLTFSTALCLKYPIL